MKSSLRQKQSSRVVAEFGDKNNPSNPLFLLEREEEKPGAFVFRDADDIGGPLATARLDHVNPKTREADLDLEVNTHPAELAYRMTVGDIRRGVEALMENAGVEKVHLVGNVSEESLRKMGCHATNEVVDFTHAKQESGEAIAA